MMVGKIKKDLTPEQQRLYNFIMDKKNWRHPTYGKIMKGLDLSSPGSVYKMLVRIKKRGWDVPFLK